MAAAASRARIGRGGDVTPPPPPRRRASRCAPGRAAAAAAAGWWWWWWWRRRRRRRRRRRAGRARGGQSCSAQAKSMDEACGSRAGSMHAPAAAAASRDRRRDRGAAAGRPCKSRTVRPRPAFYRRPPDRRRCGAGPQGPPSAGGPRPLLRPDFILLLRPPTRPPAHPILRADCRAPTDSASLHGRIEHPASLTILRRTALGPPCEPCAPSPSPPWFLMAGARETPCTG